MVWERVLHFYGIAENQMLHFYFGLDVSASTVDVYFAELFNLVACVIMYKNKKK